MNADQIPELPNELKSLEADLASLLPTTGTLRRDELMYRAGWEACAAAATGAANCPTELVVASSSRVIARTGRAASWLWPLSTAGLLLVSATLGVLLASRGEPAPRVVYVERPTAAVVTNERTEPRSAAIPASVAAQASPSLSKPVYRQARIGDDYLSLRERVLAFGVDVLPSTAPAPSPAVESRGDTRYGAMIGNLLGG